MVSKTSCTFTPSCCALVRSRCAKSCGTPMEKLEKTPCSAGSFIAFIWICIITPASAASPRSVRSSTCSLKPPMVPRPCTDGGGKMAMMALRCWAYFICSFWAMARPDSAAPWRSSKGFSPTNTMPADGLLMKPLMDRPGKAMAASTPGSLSAISDISRMTFSVRSRVAPCGSCAKLTRYCLSWIGTKPGGTSWNMATVAASSPPYTTSAVDLRFRMAPTPRP